MATLPYKITDKAIKEAKLRFLLSGQEPFPAKINVRPPERFNWVENTSEVFLGGNVGWVRVNYE